MFMSTYEIHHVIAKAGGATPLAKKLGITSQAISQWKRIPAARLEAVSDITDIPLRALLKVGFPPKGDRHA